MARNICIISGKGGVGKTTTAICLSHLMNKHKKVLLVDANLTTPNVNIHLGSPILKNSMMNVLKEDLPLEEVICHHKSGIRLIPSVTSMHDLKTLDYNKLKEILRKVRAHAEIIIID